MTIIQLASQCIRLCCYTNVISMNIKGNLNALNWGCCLSRGSVLCLQYTDVKMSAMASQITSLTIANSTVYSGRSKKTSKLRVSGLCAGISLATGEFPAQRASNAENVSIWWRHHEHNWGPVTYICTMELGYHWIKIYTFPHIWKCHLGIGGYFCPDPTV